MTNTGHRHVNADALPETELEELLRHEEEREIFVADRSRVARAILDSTAPPDADPLVKWASRLSVENFLRLSAIELDRQYGPSSEQQIAKILAEADLTLQRDAARSRALSVGAQS